MRDEQTPYSYMTKGNEESITAWQERTWASEERIAELEQELQRLRGALEHIAMLERDFLSDPEGNAGVTHDKAAVARKALEDKT